MNIMQGVLILSTLLAVSVRSQNTVDSLFLQVSDMEDAGMIFAGSVAIKVKFIHSKKATKFCEISTLFLSYVVPVKTKVEVLQNFVAFSEHMNFTR